MNQNFLNSFRVCRFALRANAFFLIVICLSAQPGSFGQTNVLTRAQFSRFSVIERARFFESTISRIASEEQVDPYLLWTIAYNETKFRPWLKSYASAEGLMQFIPATASRFNLLNPYQPEPAIRAAARYIRFLSNHFGGRVDSILAGYNAGEGAVDAFLTGRTVRAGKKIINPSGIKTVGGVPPYRETIGYVARGLVVYRLLRARQMFSGIFVSSVYPPTVSESVARAAQSVGSDESFFEDQLKEKPLFDLYHEKAGTLDEEADTEVDLASYAYQIWKNAIDADKTLAKKIPDLPKVSYSTRPFMPTNGMPEGVLVYVRTAEGTDSLAWIDKNGASITESQLAILQAAACHRDTPALRETRNITNSSAKESSI